MIKFAIIDDNPLHIAEVEQKLGQCIRTRSSYSISKFLSADAYLEIIDSETFDIIFLDIVLNKSSGIELGKKINEKHPRSIIIFVSSESYYFKDVYQVSHSYFLIKPFEDPRFNDAIKKAVKSVKKNSITLETKTGNIKIVLADVLYFENFLKHTIVHMVNGDTLEFNTNLKNIEVLLPSSGFVRTHQSFIVNMEQIIKYDRQYVHLPDSIKIPISRTYINTAREKITFFLGGVL